MSLEEQIKGLSLKQKESQAILELKEKLEKNQGQVVVVDFYYYMCENLNKTREGPPKIGEGMLQRILTLGRLTPPYIALGRPNMQTWGSFGELIHPGDFKITVAPKLVMLAEQGIFVDHYEQTKKGTIPISLSCYLNEGKDNGILNLLYSSEIADQILKGEMRRLRGDFIGTVGFKMYVGTQEIQEFFNETDPEKQARGYLLIKGTLDLEKPLYCKIVELLDKKD